MKVNQMPPAIFLKKHTQKIQALVKAFDNGRDSNAITNERCVPICHSSEGNKLTNREIDHGGHLTALTLEGLRFIAGHQLYQTKFIMHSGQPCNC